MQQIYHKKNELFEVELCEDKECTQAFDFMDKKDLYIKLVNGDITPLVRLRNQAATWQNIYTPYLCEQFKYYEPLDRIITLNDITPDLSKYIPEDNAVMFLSEECCNKYSDYFKNIRSLYASTGCYNSFEIFDKNKKCILSNNAWFGLNKKLTLFLPHGTKSELQKAEEVAKELIENHGVEEVNLFALHWFNKDLYELIQNKNGSYTTVLKYKYFNKIITTNSTGILPVQDKKRLQVIDCKEMFEEYLKKNNLL